MELIFYSKGFIAGIYLDDEEKDIGDGQFFANHRF
jgi:hypothetical protein